MGNKESGRRSKYNPTVHAEIIRNLKLGAFKRHAAEAARISYQVLDEWLAKGRDGIEPYVQLAIDVDQALAEDALTNQAIITKAARGKHDGDWKAAAWNLERKHPKLYGTLPAHVRADAARPDRERPHSPWLKRADAPANDNTSSVDVNDPRYNA